MLLNNSLAIVRANNSRYSTLTMSHQTNHSIRQNNSTDPHHSDGLFNWDWLQIIMHRDSASAFKAWRSCKSDIRTESHPEGLSAGSRGRRVQSLRKVWLCFWIKGSSLKMAVVRLRNVCFFETPSFARGPSSFRVRRWIVLNFEFVFERQMFGLNIGSEVCVCDFARWIVDGKNCESILHNTLIIW